MKVLEFLIDAFSWLKIVASPFLIAVIIATIIYLNVAGTLGLVLSVSMLLVGLVAGVILATHIWKTQGTTTFLSRIHATPELDKVNEEKK
ncbi:MAG: hypothetical protein ACK44D_01090 [Bacteroidia bacterium]|jgi:hypothetical protein